MINILILLLFFVVIQLLKERKLDFLYSFLIFTALLAAYILEKESDSKIISLIMLGGICLVTYSFCTITGYKKKMVRLIQEKAIMKHKLEKRL